MASQGDSRVHFVMNLVLSTLFGYVIVFGLSFVDVVAFSWRTVGVAAAIVFGLTYLFVLSG